MQLWLHAGLTVELNWLRGLRRDLSEGLGVLHLQGVLRGGLRSEQYWWV